MKEFARIAEYLAPLVKGTPEALSLKDDAALIPAATGLQYAITKDAIVEGTHFLPGTEAGLVAKKLIRTNLSDIAAMGATPKFFLIAAALPDTVDDAWYQAFTAAVAEEQALWGIALLGGDTVATSGVLTLSLTMLGEVPEGKALLRSGAKAGDDVYVSGTLGDAAMGLQCLQGTAARNETCIRRYHIPEPRVALGLALRGVASACMDISDGLLADLGHLCRVSGVSATVHAQALPVSDAAVSVELAATGGDDYELLFTAPSAQAEKIRQISERLALRLTLIGQVEEGSGVTLLDKDGKALHFSRTGWQHG